MVDRVAALQAKIAERGLDALFVTEPGNRHHHHQPRGGQCRHRLSLL
jgi:hypothetical protein